MKLKTKLLLSALVQIVLAIVLSAFLSSAAQKSGLASSSEERATKIVDVISQIRFATFENLLHHDQRSYEQWQSRHKSLPALLEPGPQSSNDEKALLADIQKLSSEVEVVFGRLVASYSQTGAEQQELQARLATQLLIKQQTQINDALALASLAHDEALALRQQADVLVGVVIFSMLALTIANFFFLTRTISQSLRMLQKGAEEIAAGNFAYRLQPQNRKDEFGRVARAFNSMAASVGQLDKVKSEFILLASHQLRTPLTAVKWYSKALINAGESMQARRQKRYAKQVYDSNQRMIQLVDKLLDASRVESDNLLPQPTAVKPEVVLKQALADVSAEVRENQIHVSVTKHLGEHEFEITIDPTWMRVIFQNLLSNAARYSRPGQNVEVILKREDDDLLITVKDEGYGIPADQHAKVFTKLFRADNAKRAIGEGSGLGLYISKAMVQRAGGKIWFESTENKGARFFVRLPLRGKR